MIDTALPIDTGDSAQSEGTVETRAAVRWAMILVLVLTALLFVLPAGRRPFWSSDEARPALLAQDILNRGDWLVPSLRERLYLNKPQLYFWSVAVASLPAGRVTEATAAIPSAVSTVAAAAGVMAIGTLLWGPPAGIVAALVFATIPHYFDIGHSILPDVMLNAWMIWALYFFLASQRAAGGSWRLAAFYLCVAGGVLTKGPQGFAALGAAIAAIALTHGPRAVRRLRPLLGGGILAVALLVWLVPYQTHSRGAFTGQVIGGHYVTWFVHGALLPRLGHMMLAFGSFLPWTAFLAGAVVWWRRSPDPGRRQVAIWTLTLWILIGMSGTFRTRYLLPVYPGLALLVAEFVARAPARGGRVPLRIASAATAVLAFAAAVAILSPLIDQVTGDNLPYVPQAQWERTVMAGLCVMGGIALLLALRRDALTLGPAAFSIVLAAMLVITAVRYPARYTAANDVRGLSAVAAAHAPPEAVVLAYPDLRLSYDFYLQRRVVELPSVPQVVARLADASSRDVLITTRDRWSALAPLVPAAWQPLAQARVGGREVVVVGSRR